jgi:dTDP-4-dehydrorhamnose reductase
VRELAEICETKGARMIHISTDYVFDGAKTTPYTEEDAVIPISIYGGSKYRGEQELLAVSGRHLAVRVSWVFGPDRPSFIDGILKRAQAEEKVDAIGDKLSTPTYTLDIAGYLRPFLVDIPEGGVLHLSNAGECSWQEYGQYALDCAAGAGLPLKAKRVDGIRLADLKAFVAKRPVYTVLSTGKFTGLTGTEPRTWQAAVESYVETSYAKMP